jgi:hypothetical protein
VIYYLFLFCLITVKYDFPLQQFVQSFFLAEHMTKPNAPTYYVLNDTFRIVGGGVTSPIASESQSQPQSVADLFKSAPANHKSPPEATPPTVTIEETTKKTTSTAAAASAPTPNNHAPAKTNSPPAAINPPQATPVPPKVEEEEAKEKKPFSWANMVKEAPPVAINTTNNTTNSTAPAPVPPMTNDSNQNRQQSRSRRGGPASNSTAPPQPKQANQASGGGGGKPAAKPNGEATETELQRKTRKLNAAISPEEMPSTAIYVKGLEVQKTINTTLMI